MIHGAYGRFRTRYRYDHGIEYRVFVCQIPLRGASEESALDGDRFSHLTVHIEIDNVGAAADHRDLVGIHARRIDQTVGYGVSAVRRHPAQVDRGRNVSRIDFAQNAP